jgi:hypothetical protein
MNIIFFLPRAWSAYPHTLLVSLPFDVPTTGVLASVLLVAIVLSVWRVKNSLRWLMIFGGALTIFLVVPLLKLPPAQEAKEPVAVGSPAGA